MSQLPAFEVSYDYLCPFAHIAHEHLVAGLQAGAKWDVTFTPWTLRQVHKEEGAPDVWDDPDKVGELIALESSLAIRDGWPDRYLEAHLALYRARFEQSVPLKTRDEVAVVLDAISLDTAAVFEVVDTGGPRKELAESWRRLSEDHAAFGVPTFVVDNDAVFVRLMDRPASGDDAIATIEWIVNQLIENPRVNEFKHTKIVR
jgi:2-hydroxychromene-2-carboxylate isomerase